MSQTDPTRRALRLLDLLQARSVWSGPELAARLGVTIRSVRRDIDRLRQLGYPVEGAPGAGGGYQLGAGKALPPLLLDDEEAVAIAVSLRLAADGTLAGASEAAVSTLAKLDQVMPPRLRSSVKALHDSTLTLGGVRDVVDGDVLLTIARACRDLVRLRFGYAARDGADSERRVEPVRLVATGRRWHLMAWDVDREDWRTFRLDRMREVAASTWRFRPRDHPDPAAYVRESVHHAPFTHHARVRVHAPLAEVAARTDPRWVTLTAETEDTTVLEASADSLEAMAFHVVWLGFECDLLAPDGLADAARALASRLWTAAHRGGGS